MSAAPGFWGQLANQYRSAVAQRSPMLGALMNAYGRYRQHQQPDQSQPLSANSISTTDENTPPPSPDAGNYDWAAGGKIVTSPTRVILGESGPEKVVPLNNAPDNKVAPSLTDQPIKPAMQAGQSGTRTRFAHVSGPNALGRYRPLRSDLPLIPNKAVR